MSFKGSGPEFVHPSTTIDGKMIKPEKVAVTVIPKGTRVMYHGSVEHRHGPMRVVDIHFEMTDTYGEHSPVRYTLQYGPDAYSDVLMNVRPVSFTVIGKWFDK